MMSPRQGLKLDFFTAARFAGANWAVRRCLRRRLAVLGYHGGVGSDDAAMPESLPQRMALAETIRGGCKSLSDDDKEAYLHRLRDEPVRLDDSRCDATTCTHS